MRAGRSEHSVDLVSQTTICGHTRHLTDDNPLPCSFGISKDLGGCLWCRLARRNEKKEQIIMSISRLKALRCRRMLDAAGAAGRLPGNHLHPPDLAGQALTPDTKDKKVMTPRKIPGRGGSGSARCSTTDRSGTATQRKGTRS
jgi:hypothetical protein